VAPDYGLEDSLLSPMFFQDIQAGTMEVGPLQCGSCEAARLFRAPRREAPPFLFGNTKEPYFSNTQPQPHLETTPNTA